jgi:hypothetical protein
MYIARMLFVQWYGFASGAGVRSATAEITREKLMRLIALAMTAAMLVAAPAQAAWKDYTYKEYGFAVNFPAPPKVSKGAHRGVVAAAFPPRSFPPRKTAPSTRW